MAANKVLGIAELLELILLNLPMHDLLLVQRVCRQWRACIRSSSRLKEKLFLQTPEPCPRPDTDPKVEMNPLLQETFPAFFTHLETLDRGIFNDTKADSSTLSDERLSLLRVASCNPSLKAQGWYQDASRREAVLRREASWRRMFPSHPPPRLGVFHAHQVGCGCGAPRLRAGRPGERHRRFNRSPGARMWLIWDAVMFFRDDFPSGVFSVSWWRRRAPVGDAGFQGENDPESAEMKTWILELVVDTRPTWDCYSACRGYKRTGFGIAEYEDLIAYDDYGDHEDVMAKITKHEAPPVSVMKKFVREAKAKMDAAKNRDWLADTGEDSEDPDKCSTEDLHSLVEHYHGTLKQKSLPQRPG
ncbi:hypothetical protein BJX68DRAFT_270517 [Aspergillus pseudodeflectus]|uniref:F-box domain-containing protein n=1 Tax=Aspergillus pseudodeflectus TaxID=176178 RepID=A0ABR4JUF3_9EURO